MQLEKKKLIPPKKKLRIIITTAQRMRIFGVTSVRTINETKKKQNVQQKKKWKGPESTHLFEKH